MDSKQTKTADITISNETEGESCPTSISESREIRDNMRGGNGSGEALVKSDLDTNLDVDASDKDKSEDVSKSSPEGEVKEDSLPEVRMLEDIKSLSVDEYGQVDPAVVELLASGFVERFLPGLRRTQTTLDQIRSSQDVLLDTVQQELSKFRDCQAVNQVEATMTKARHYHNKLLRLRREMTSLHDKSKKLKKRALKLQQQKQSEELTRAHTREHELEKERMLTARVAPSPPSPS